MANAVRLDSPYVIGGDTINDGDYITLSIQDYNINSIENTRFGVGAFVSTGGGNATTANVTSNTNYVNQAAKTRSISVNQNLDTMLYVNNDTYTFQPTLQVPKITYANNPGIGSGGRLASSINNGNGIQGPYATQSFNDPPIANTQYYTQTVGTSDVVLSPTSINCMRAQNWYVTGYPNNGAVEDASRPLQDGGLKAEPMLTNGSSSVPKSTSQPPLLCVELKEDDYLALRCPNGKYLHLLPAGQADGSTLSGVQNQIPQSLVLSYSDLPSSLHTAQWSVYLMGGTQKQVLLLNRATNTCLTWNTARQVAINWVYYQCVPNKAGTQQFLYNYIYGNNVSGSGQLFYDSYTSMSAQWWDTYMQQYYRLTGTASIDQAGTSTMFTMTRVAANTCNPGLNPLNSICTNGTNGADPITAAAILQTCRRGDMFSTPNCQNWAIANPDLAQDAVLTYCANNPNDLTFCGCENVWPFTELIDYLSLTTPPTTVYAECNLAQCQPAAAWRSTTQKNRKCVQKICAQGINFNGSISNSTLTKVEVNCNINDSPSSSTADSPSTTNSTGQVVSAFQPILNAVNSFYTTFHSKWGYTQLIIVLLIMAILFCCIVITLNFVSLKIAGFISIACGIVVFFSGDL